MRTRHPSGSGTDASPTKERRHRPSTHSSPRKSSVPAAVQGESQSARARREAASQSVDDSATRRIEPTTVYWRPCLGESSVEWFCTSPLPDLPRLAEPSLHEQTLRCEGHLIAQNVEAGARQFMRECLHGQQRVALTPLAFVKAFRCR